MDIKAQIVIMSHLSDIQETQTMMQGSSKETFIFNKCFKDMNHKINFVKFLIQRYPNTLDKIDPDKEYADFIKKHPNL